MVVFASAAAKHRHRRRIYHTKSPRTAAQAHASYVRQQVAGTYWRPPLLEDAIREGGGGPCSMDRRVTDSEIGAGHHLFRSFEPVPARSVSRAFRNPAGLSICT